MANDKTMTAPLAVIKTQDGTIIGKMRNIRVTENYRRGDVRGLGALTAQEKPVVAVDCSLTASFYTINIKKFGTLDSAKLGLNRSTGDVSAYANTLLLNEVPVNIYINKKSTVGATVVNGVVTFYGEEEFAVIRNFFIDSTSFDITEGNVSGTDLTGTYTEPILFAIGG